jgi:hypothetical protein
VAAICCLDLITKHNLSRLVRFGAQESYFCCQGVIWTIHILLLPHVQHFSWPLQISSFWGSAGLEDSFVAYKRSKTSHKSSNVTCRDSLK